MTSMTSMTSMARQRFSQRAVGDLTGLTLGSSLQIQERIGRGGMGSVYLAQHRDWNLSLAVKSPRPDLLTSDVDRERWLLEAQTWIDLGVHPNIVRCWFIREHDGIPLLFLDYVAGGSLKEALEQRVFGIANWPKFLDLAIQACDGLEHAHRSGIVHRDVKPANLLIDDAGGLFVTDFGLVKLQSSQAVEPVRGKHVDFSESDASLTSTGTVLGTPNYCAPEQWLGDNVGVPADLYAMGVILFEMATGQLPFEASPGPMGLGQLLTQVISEEAPSPRSLQPACPESLDALILQLLAKDPEDRPVSAAALREELVLLYRQLTGSDYPRPHPKPVEAVTDVLNNKAVSLHSLGRKKTAEDTWQQALRLDSLHPDVVYNRGWLLWRQGRHTAQELTSSLRQVCLTYPRAHTQTGLAHLCSGEWEAAAEQLGAAVKLADAARDSSVWRCLGDAELGQERYAEAELAYGKALELNPSDPYAQAHLELARGKTRKRGGRYLFPRTQPLLRLQRQHKLTQVQNAGSGWFWAGPDHLELLPADSRSRSWSVVHEVNLKRALISLSEGKVLAADCAPTPSWSAATGAMAEEIGGGRHFCVSPDGRHTVAGMVELQLFDLRTLALSGRPLRGHEKQVLCAMYCGSGKLLTGACDRTARIWDVERATALQTLQGHRDYVTCLAYNPETGLVMTGSQDGTARTWRSDTGECFRILDESANPVTSVAFACAGQLAVVGTSHGSEPWTSFWDLRTGEMSRRLAGTSRVSPDGQFVITFRCQEDLNWIEVREALSGCVRRVMHPEGGAVSDLCFSEDGRYFACVTLSGGFLLYEFDEATRVFPQELLLTYTRGGSDLEKHRAEFSALLAEAQAHFEAGQHSGCLAVLQKARAVPGYLRDPDARALTRQLAVHLQRGNLLSCWETRLMGAADRGDAPLALLPGGDRLLCASDKVLRLWDSARGNCIRGFPGHSDLIRGLSVGPGGERALTGSLDRGVRCWNLASGECLSRVAVTRGGVIGLHWVAEKSLAIALTNLYSVCGLDLDGLTQTWTTAVPGATWMVGLGSGASPRGDLVWLGGARDPGRMVLVDGSNGKICRALKAEREADGAALASAAVCFAAGKHGLSADPQGRIHFWDLSEGRHLGVLLEAEGPVTQLAVSHDGLCLALALESGSVQLWDLGRKLLRQTLDGPWGQPGALRLAPDGCELFILGSDGVLRVWEMEWELGAASGPARLGETVRRPGFWSRLLRGFRS